MKNIEYTVDEQSVDEQGSSFEVMNTGDSVNFSDYVDPRSDDYYESNISEHEELVYNEPTITDNDDKFYDALESEFGSEKENDEYHYVKMKKGYKTNEEVWDVLRSTKWSSSNAVTISSLEDVLSRDDEYKQAA